MKIALQLCVYFHLFNKFFYYYLKLNFHVKENDKTNNLAIFIGQKISPS